MKKLPAIIFLLLIFIIFTITIGCNNGEASKRMDSAEAMMDSMPDSALCILSAIDRASLGNDGEKARHSLLLSMALDKNYIDTTSFDVLQPALDYYLDKGTPNQKLGTLYYQGRIFQNSGDDENAMASFFAACDLIDKVSDTLTLAHSLTALGSIYFSQYKTPEYTQCQLSAARLYGRIGKKAFELNSFINALLGYIMMSDRQNADSLMKICLELDALIEPEGDYMFSPTLSYVNEFGSEEDIKNFLNECSDSVYDTDDALNMAYAYSKIGDNGKALDIISNTAIPPSVIDTLKHTVMKINFLEIQKEYEPLARLYGEYTVMQQRYHKQLLSDDRLFADRKHELELDKLKQIEARNTIIWAVACGILVLIAVTIFIYARLRVAMEKRTRMEKENENLRLEGERLQSEMKRVKLEADYLRSEKERAELERDKKILEADYLRSEKERAELERDKKTLEADYLRSEKERAELERDKKILEANILESESKRLQAESALLEMEAETLRQEKSMIELECESLKKLLNGQSCIDKSIMPIIRKRIDILYTLLAKEISNSHRGRVSCENLIMEIRKDREEFMTESMYVLEVSHPEFMAYLKLCGLTEYEIKIVCLYAIGLRVMDVREYVQQSGIHNVNHVIRKKFGMNEHDTNIDLYVKRKMAQYDKA